VVGDIYICVPVAREHAARLGLAAAVEVRRLVIHGVLHVLGYDHPDGDGRTRSPMWRRQERYLTRFARRTP
jgi:probable rRNA maturation factor